MINIFNIYLFQYTLDKIKNIVSNLFNKFFIDNKKIYFIEDINHFNNVQLKEKRALLKLSPEAWKNALKEYPNIKSFNITGFTYELVKILNENGYLVDICDVNEEFEATKRYDLFIGHGGKCVKTINSLDDNTPILQYISGSFWKKFNEESKERYMAFSKRKNVKEKLNFKRSFNGLEVGEEYLSMKSDILFGPNCPRMIATYGKYKYKYFITGWHAYINPLLKKELDKADFERGSKNFIYVGGTGGNIQKGMDIILETFAICKELNLYIFCKVEEEILKYYKKELSLPNIHYIYHWRFKPYQKKLKNLVNEINFTIHAPINTGIGTAFLGSIGAGFIPVGYVDILASDESCVVADAWDIDSLIKCVKEASKKSAKWCRNAAELNIDNYQKNWSLEYFRRRLNILINNINIETI